MLIAGVGSAALGIAVVTVRHRPGRHRPRQAGGQRDDGDGRYLGRELGRSDFSKPGTAPRVVSRSREPETKF
jgi:hypothetical protein